MCIDVCMDVYRCVYGCVCVRERERERAPGCACVPVFLAVFVKESTILKAGGGGGSVGRAGEISQRLGSLTALQEGGPEFKSQQSHGGSQPPVMRSDAPFWCI
jgi:hypothetical protein